MLVDSTYYTGTYKADSTVDFDKLNARSQPIILSLIKMTEAEATAHERVADIKNAICAQIEYLATNADAINKGTMQSESIGSYSYTKKDSESQRTYKGIPLSPMIEIYLKGLLKGGAFIHVC